MKNLNLPTMNFIILLNIFIRVLKLGSSSTKDNRFSYYFLEIGTVHTVNECPSLRYQIKVH